MFLLGLKRKGRAPRQAGWERPLQPDAVPDATLRHGGRCASGLWTGDLPVNLKLAVASALGSLIGLALLVSRMLRQKQIVAEEVSSLRHLGSGRRGATPSRRP